MIKGCHKQTARFRQFLNTGRENVRKAYQWAEAAGKTLPTPVRWLLIAFIVLFVVGPGLSFGLWLAARSK